MTVVEVRGYKFHWDWDARAFVGLGVPPALQTFVSLVTPPDYQASIDPNQPATFARYLQEKAGARIVSVDPTEELKEGVTY